jgi:hypothetical protein
MNKININFLEIQNIINNEMVRNHFESSKILSPDSSGNMPENENENKEKELPVVAMIFSGDEFSFPRDKNSPYIEEDKIPVLRGERLRRAFWKRRQNELIKYFKGKYVAIYDFELPPIDDNEAPCYLVRVVDVDDDLNVLYDRVDKNFKDPSHPILIEKVPEREQQDAIENLPKNIVRLIGSNVKGVFSVSERAF